MERCFQIDLRTNKGYTLLMVFNAMKEMQQESNLIDDSVTISYDDKIRLTAGFYDSFDDFDDLFMSVLFKDKELNYFPNIQDPDVRKAAFWNVFASLRRVCNGKIDFSASEIEELERLSVGKTK